MRTFEITVERVAVAPNGAGDGSNGASDAGAAAGNGAAGHGAAVYPVVVQYADGSGLPVRSEGVLRLGTEALRAAYDTRAYGALLGDAVFQGRVRDAFMAARARRGAPTATGGNGAAGSNGSAYAAGAVGVLGGENGAADPLRVLLYVEAPELWALRWERLCAPSASTASGWDFLRLDQDAPLSLYLPSLTDRRFPPIGRRELRALVVVASPSGLERYGLGPIDVPATVASVREALGEIPTDVLLSDGAVAAPASDTVGPATLDALCDRLTAAPYTLLHVVAHGQFIRRGPQQGETLLYLAGADGGVEPVPASRLIERLGRLSGAQGLPRLAFLATCESAAPEAEGALGGLGQRLVRELGMPAVVAMTEPVTIVTAQALATRFYARLRAHGEPDRALTEASAGLAERKDATVPALYSRLGGRPLFDDALDRPLRSADIAFGLARLGGTRGADGTSAVDGTSGGEGLITQRAPVLRARFGPLAATLRGTMGVEPEALAPAARAEREVALTELDAVAQEATEISFAALALGREPPPYDGRCPFRGLYPFRAADREFFVGREALIEGLKNRLSEHAFLAVLGPSGCGKSSVVFAGLVPSLEQAWPGLQVVTCTPGDDPVARLEAALATRAGAEVSLVVVDQFEEAFTLCTDASKRGAFFARVLALADERPVVVTMRADFWGECAPYVALREAMQAHQELVAPMDATELRRSVEEQAKRVGLRFEADVANRMLDDVAQEPGAMPLLQHALLELWKRRHGRWLKADEYRELGGVAQAIARTADDLYEQLSDDERLRTRDVFLRLTRLGDDAGSDGARRDTRQRVRLAELVPPAADAATHAAAESATSALVARLASARLVVTTRDAASGEDQVEVAHEALIRYWPRLREWLDESRAALRLRSGVRDASLEWEQGGRDEALLVHRGARLDEAVALAKGAELGGGIGLNAEERAYVHACAALREREARERELGHRREVRRLRLFVTGVGAAALVAVALAVFALGERRTAQTHARSAEALALASSAISALTTDPELATLLAIEAVRLDPTQKAEDALRRAVRRTHLQAVLPTERPVLAAELVPDGRRVVAWVGDGSPAGGAVEIWDTAARRRVASIPNGTLVGSGGAPRGRWTAAGRALVGMATGGEVRVVGLEDGRVVATLSGHAGGTRSASLSPDGTRVVTTGGADVMRVWDAATGAPVAGFSGHGEGKGAAPGTWAVFTADGKQVVSYGMDAIVRVWDAASGVQVRVLRDPQGPFTYATPGPDAQLVVAYVRAAGASGGEVPMQVWDVGRGVPLATLSPWIAPDSITFSPDGAQLAARNHNGLGIWVLNGAGGAEGESVEWEDLKTWTDVAGVEFMPDHAHVVVAGFELNRAVRVILDGTDVSKLVAPVVWTSSNALPETRVSADGRVAMSRDMDQRVRLWDLLPDREVGTLGLTGIEWDETLLDVTFSDAGRGLVGLLWKPGSLLLDQSSLVRFAPDGKVVSRTPLAGGQGQPLFTSQWRFSPDGSRLLGLTVNELPGGGTGSGMVLWDTATGARLATQPALDDSVFPDGAAFSPDSRWLVLATATGTVQLIDAVSGQTRTTLRVPVPVFGVGVAPGGKAVGMTTMAGKELTIPGGIQAGVWDGGPAPRLLDLGDDAKTVGQSPFTAGIPEQPIVFSADGARLLVARGGPTAYVWDLARRRLTRLEGHELKVQAAAFTRDGRQVLTASDDRTVRVWDAASGTLMRTLRGHPGVVNAIAVSPDGLLAASSGFNDVAVRLWRLADGRGTELAARSNALRGSLRVAFSPDGRRLLSQGAGLVPQLFVTDLQELVEVAKQRVTRGLTAEERETYLGQK